MKKKLFLVVLLFNLLTLPIFAQGRFEYEGNVSAKDYLQKKALVDGISNLKPEIKGDKYESTMFVRNYQYKFINGESLSFERDMMDYISIYRTKHYEIIPSGTHYFGYALQPDGNIRVKVFHDVFTQEEVSFFSRKLDGLSKRIPSNVHEMSDDEKLMLAFDIVKSELSVGSDKEPNWEYYNNYIRAFENKNNKTACNGWATFSSEVLRLLKIESKPVQGYYGEKSVESRHAWNAVKINDEWVFVDFMYAKGYEDESFLKIKLSDSAKFGYIVDIGFESINAYYLK